MPETPRGWVSYPTKGSSPWYTENDAGTSTEGLEQWLASIELMGIPTYATFADLPAAGSTDTKSNDGNTQRQFAAVEDEETIYRDDGTAWQEWAFGAGASPTWTSNHTFDGGIDLDGTNIDGVGQFYGEDGSNLTISANSSNDTDTRSIQFYTYDGTSFVETVKLEKSGDMDINGNSISSVSDIEYNGADGSITIPEGEHISFRYHNSQVGTYLDIATFPTSGAISFNNDLQVTNIVDSNSNDRVVTNAFRTELFDETGSISYRTESGQFTRVFAESTRPVQIYDSANNQTAFKYTTGNPGTLELTNANLQIPAGQAITDDSGNNRVEILSGDGNTQLSSSAGNTAFQVRDDMVRAFVNTGAPLRVRDTPNSQTAFRYDVGNPGTLELTNAVLDFNGNSIVATDDTEAVLAIFESFGNVGSWSTSLTHDSDKTRLGHNSSSRNLTFGTNGGDELVLSGSFVRVKNADLRIDEGKELQDGSAVQRMGILSGGTVVYDQNGGMGVQVIDDRTTLNANSGKDITFYDRANSHNLGKFSVGNPGTLTLENADLDVGGNNIQMGTAGTIEGDQWDIFNLAQIRGDANEGALRVRSTDNASNSPQPITFEQAASGTWDEVMAVESDGVKMEQNLSALTLGTNTGPGTNSEPILVLGSGGAGIYVDGSGDVVAVDNDGNISVLT